MKNFFIGMLIGTGAIMPGVSSGVFCVAFGLYEKLIDSILHFFKDVKRNFLFLFPIVSGAFISIFLLSKMLLFAFDRYNLFMSYAFIGLIIGSIPTIKKQANIEKLNIFHVMCFTLSLLFSIYMVLIEKGNTNSTSSSFSFSYLVLIGIAMSSGIIIPGVSKTAILMMLGIYTNYLTAISTLNLKFLIPIGIGIILGSVVFMHIINYMFLHFKSYTYSLIIGFVVGSCFVIFPGFAFNIEYIISIFVCMISFRFVKKLNKYY